MGSDYIFTANPYLETQKYALKIASKNSSILIFLVECQKIIQN